MKKILLLILLLSSCHLQHGYVTDTSLNRPFGKTDDETWYLLENDELGLINHWVPEYKLELHKQPLRESKLNQLGI